MTSGIDFDETAITSLRLHYEAIAYTNLRELWKRRWLIVSIVLSVAALASVVLVMMGLRYTGEALIQLDFNREEAPVGARSQPIASLDAASLVDSAARIIRSRATASAVVARIGLDKGPLSASQWPARVLASAWAALGVEPATLSAHDLATNELMSKIEVRNEPRSYLISVKVTSKDPDQAATLANAVALEYLRWRVLQELAGDQAAAERDLTNLAGVYGARHPNYVRARATLEQLEARTRAMRDEVSNEDLTKLLAGKSLLAAQKVIVPSGPSFPLTVGFAAAAALAGATWFALRLERGTGSPYRTDTTEKPGPGLMSNMIENSQIRQEQGDLPAGDREGGMA